MYQRNQVGQPGALNGLVAISAAGINYQVNDTITLAAASFGGAVGNGAITLTVPPGGVGLNGELLAVTIAYTPVALTSTFSLNE